MSGGKLSVVTQFPSRLNPFSSLKSDNLSLSSAADSPENRADIAVGVVTVPGVDKDFHIKDIPIVTDDHGGRSSDMLYMKPVTPSDNIAPPSYLTSTCSSPDTVSSLETSSDPSSCQATNLDQMYMNLTKEDSNVVMAENVQLREMLVSQLDLIQQQSETIMSKDKQLRQLQDENSLLLSRLSRMERRCRGDQTPAGSSSLERKGTPMTQSGTKRTRDSDTTPDNQFKKKKVETKACMEPSISVSKEPIEAFGPCDDELTDEFMSDLLSVGSRPDTPVSIASLDAATSDTAQKSSKKSKKQQAEKRKSLGTPAVVAESSGEKSKKAKVVPSEQAKPSVPPVPPHETDHLYFVGCKNDLLPNVDDHLEVTSLQRGVEVRLSNLNVLSHKFLFLRCLASERIPTITVKWFLTSFALKRTKRYGLLIILSH